jgi:hypothetical protein
MLKLLNQELISALAQTILGALLAIAIYLSQKLYEYFKTRNVRRFWHPFIGKSLTVIVTEYSPIGNDRFARLARVMGNRWLISRGMAFSLANLLDFCGEHIVKRRDILAIGDKSGNQTTDNVIILGNPANNIFAASILRHLSEMYEIPYEFVWDPDAINTKIAVDTDNDTKLIPEYKSGLGHDYGLIIKATYQAIPLKSMLLIAGCHVWGTQASTSAVTDIKILNEVARYTNGASNIAFIIKTRILNNNSSGPELDIGNRKYIQILKPKRAG